ncbi:ribokinase [candidate division KSB1 bacterium]|nr:ribokinase [candidate division KSB1 bacterium]
MRYQSKIAVVGSINMDLIALCDTLPRLGETVIGKSFAQAPGGKGANQAVAAARLGGKVKMIGCVGNAFGADLLDSLQQSGVDTAHVSQIQDTSSGLAAINVDKDGNNTLIYIPGANLLVTPQVVEDNEATIAESDILVLQFEIPPDTVSRAVEIAHKHRIPVVLNPSPYHALDKSLYSMVDYLIPNEIEGAAIAGVEHANLHNIVTALLKSGVKNVIMTIGEKGALYSDGQGIHHQPAYKVKALDTTAAGDAFLGAFALAISSGERMPQAVAFATKVSALSVQKVGAQPSLPSLADVQNFVL